MRLSIFDKRRWFEVRDRHGNSASERTLGDAIENALRDVTRFGFRMEIWECEGNSSYTSTHLLNVKRGEDGRSVVIEETPQ